MDISNCSPLAYSINDACRVTSIGRTRLYELIAEGKLATVQVGRRRLVKADSIRALVQAA
jgi:excisionase family DNA binding protein